jgi:hypothetical protein
LSGHKDDIRETGRWSRMPYGIARRFPIDTEEVRVASAFGGAIYIDVGGEAGGNAPGLGRVGVRVDGAVEAPCFVLGKTTDAEWVASLRAKPAPYAELVTPRVAISVPSAFVRTLDQPSRVMSFWNEVVRVQDYVSANETVRTGPERINVDVQIATGLLHAGYPIQGPAAASLSQWLVDYEAMQKNGNWGYLHELGHQAQVRPNRSGNYYTLQGGGEVTVNIFAKAAEEELLPDLDPEGKHTAWSFSTRPNLVMMRAKDAIATGGDFVGKHQWDQYPFYFQLADGFGWESFRAVMQSYNRDYERDKGALPSNEAERRDQWLIRFSEATSFDLTRYMVHTWGLNVSEAALKRVAAMGLPDWMPVTAPVRDFTVSNTGSDTRSLDGLSLDDVAILKRISGPAHGTLSSNPDGTYTYRPGAGYEGSDHLDVTYESSAGNEITSRIRINVTSSPPR